MVRPVPTPVYHFTHVDNLSTILREGIQCHAQAGASGLTAVDIGNRAIKATRASRQVPVAPRGLVGDYVPFYFATRSPMLSAIDNGRVPEYTDGSDRLIYLATTLEGLTAGGAEIVLTDRNAALAFTEFHRLADGEPAEDFIDWPLMEARYWNNTNEYPDRRERRMAECLVHRSVPWESVLFVGARSQTVADQVGQIVGAAEWIPRVAVRTNWYF